MTEMWLLATLWLGLALIATLLSIWFGIATALSEIVVGTVAQLVIGALVGAAVLGANDPWIKFLSGTGAIILTFLAGAELDPVVFREKWKEAVGIGLASFFAPFLGCAAVAYYFLDWSPQASWLAGVALSTTSVAVVYAVMLEFGLNTSVYGKTVLPAYLIGMVLAGTVGKDHMLIRRLRTLTFGLLTPFYFIRAGAFVSVPALIAAPGIFLILLAAKIATKLAAVYPVTRFFKSHKTEAMYTTLLMSTGLTFGSISALFGLSQGIIDTSQYSYLVATVVASAVIPTLIANAFYLPRHLLGRAPEVEIKTADVTKADGPLLSAKESLPESTTSPNRQ